MKWMTGDRDEEIDTVHDLQGDMAVDEDDARQLQRLYEDLIKESQKMAEARDKNGNPVFTPKDIERELWSPLVRADIIPSNAVPDAYSQEAQVFNGACALYEDMLADYTENSSKHDQIQRGLRLTMDALSVVGTIGGEAAKAARLDASFIPAADELQQEKDEKAYEEAIEAGDAAKAAKLKHKIDTFKARSDDAKKAAAAAQRDGLIIKGGVALMNGLLGALDATLEKGSAEDKLSNVTEKIYGTLGDAVQNSFAAWVSHVGATDLTKSELASFKTMTSAVSNALSAALTGGQFAWRCAEAVQSARDGDIDGIKAAQNAIVSIIADAVGTAFAALDKQDGKG